MSSNCRACGRRGHWKAVCPYRTESSRPTGSSTASTAPTTTAVTEDDVILASQNLPMEFMQLPEVKESAIDEDPSAKQQGRMDEVFFVMGLGNHSHKVSEGSHNDSCETNSFNSYGGNLRPSDSARERLLARITRSESPHILPTGEKTEMESGYRSHLPRTAVSSSTEITCPSDPDDMPASVLFATHSPLGVLDLGATQTLIGSEHVSELIEGFGQALAADCTDAHVKSLSGLETKGHSPVLMHR